MDLIRKISSYTDGGHISFHMPGHKNNTDLFPFLREVGTGLDITEIEGFDDFNSPGDFFLEMEETAQKIWKSEKSFVSVNGSTALILSAIRCVSEGKSKRKIILARNCHKSVYHAVEIMDLVPVYIVPESSDVGICKGISAKEAKDVLEKNGDACALVVTSPTYEGNISHIKEIAEACHGKGIPLIVDESHGGHFGLHEFFPENSVSFGADIVIHSLHKTLFSLTQTAIAHITGNLVSPSFFRESLDIFQSSSPSYLLSSSAYETVKVLDAGIGDIFESWYYNAAETRKGLGGLNNLRLLNNDDFSKFVILTDMTDKSGAELSDILRKEYMIDPEMSGTDHVILMSGLGNRKEDYKALLEALTQIDGTLRASEKSESAERERGHIPALSVRPGEVNAITGGKKTKISLSEAEGKISSDNIYVYPPGIPILVKGEMIEKEEIAAIRKMLECGFDIRGVYDGEKISVIS